MKECYGALMSIRKGCRMSGRKTDVLIGAAKGLVLIGAFAGIPYAWLSSFACQGECTGAGWVILFVLPVLGIGALIAIPLFFYLLVKWTGNNSAQAGGALLTLPVLVVGGVAMHWFHAIQASAAIKPEYLSRTIKLEMGKIDHLLWADGGTFCRDECREVLLNGIAVTFSPVSFNRGNHWQDTVKYVFRLADIQDCKDPTPVVRETITYFQEHGIFDKCVVGNEAGPLRDGVVVRGDQNDRGNIRRPNGPTWVAAAQAFRNGELQPEFARWEQGKVPYSGEIVGEPFTHMGFVRAVTGVRTDRVAQSSSLTHAERLRLVFGAEAHARLDPYAIFTFLRNAPDYAELFRDRAGLRPYEIDSLKEAFSSNCESEPEVLASNGQHIGCIEYYNRKVDQAYPAQADALRLSPN